MTQEIIRHKKVKFVQWWIIFCILYITVVLAIKVIELVYKYEINAIVGFFLVLYMFLFLFLYWQMHYYEYTFIKGHLIIREILGKKEKYTLIIPFDHILKISDQELNKTYRYHKKKKCIKYWMPKYSLYFIEYDDYMDISLIKIQCSHEFIQSLNKHI